MTGDDRYRVPLRELIAAFPEMARSWAAFDKWIPIQVAGYLSRYLGAAMAVVQE